MKLNPNFGVTATEVPPPATSIDNEILDPITGELIDRGDPDQLIDAFERLKKTADSTYAALSEIKQSLGALTDQSAKSRTRRVRGQRRQCIVEMPAPHWEQSVLKEAWHSYPQYRDEFLKIGVIDPKLREVNKLRSTTAPDDQAFETFKQILLSAEKEPTANPSVKVEDFEGEVF